MTDLSNAVAITLLVATGGILLGTIVINFLFKKHFNDK